MWLKNEKKYGPHSQCGGHSGHHIDIKREKKVADPTIPIDKPRVGWWDAIFSRPSKNEIYIAHN